MDSATAVYEAMEQGYEPYFLYTSYGQRTEDKEYECAQALAEEVDAADFLHIETGHLSQIGTSSLTDEESACGACGARAFRVEAFRNAGVA